jgi:DNA-binding transcriptional ArsR family regulator
MQRIETTPYPMTDKVKKAVEAIGKNDYENVSGLFRSLSDPARVRIIEALGVKELCVCVLVDVTGLQYSALSYHLKHLKHAGLVDSRKDGNFLIYSLTPKGNAVQDFIKLSNKL